MLCIPYISLAKAVINLITVCGVLVSAFLQVAWLGSDEKITWESRSSLPQHLIDDFENGMQYEEAVITEAKFGAVNHTVTINMTTTTPEQPSKKSRTSLPDYTPGYEVVCTCFCYANVLCSYFTLYPLFSSTKCYVAVPHTLYLAAHPNS